MKRKIALSLALALSLFSLTVVSAGSTAQAQQRQRFRADTGFVTLGPSQVLRITVDRDTNHDGNILVRFSRSDYVQTTCSGNVCKHVETNSNPAGEPQELEPNEAASMDIRLMPGSSGVRAVIVSNRRNVRATALIINTATGETTSHIIMANTEGDF